MSERLNDVHPGAAELQAYADYEAVEERVSAHVAGCAECREAVTAIRRVTVTLSLGSKPSGSLPETIRARRAELARVAPRAPLHARRRRFSLVLLPVGLAAAAALALFVPRAWREQPRDNRPPDRGAKGALSPDVGAEEKIVTETGVSGIDSVAWDVSDPATVAELRYVTGVAESSRAARLAERVADQLMDAGLDRASITIRPVAARDNARPLPPGAVGVTLRRRAP